MADELTLRPMVADDLPLLVGWLAEQQVQRWWAEDPASAVDRYAPELASGITTYQIAMVDGAAIGMIQSYPIAAYYEFVDELAEAGVEVLDGAWSIDYLIGEPAMRGRGLGVQMIRQAVAGVWEHPSASCIVVPVHADNAASCAALRAVGFAQLPGEIEMEPDNPADDRRHLVFELVRRGPSGPNV